MKLIQHGLWTFQWETLFLSLHTHMQYLLVVSMHLYVLGTENSNLCWQIFRIIISKRKKTKWIKLDKWRQVNVTFDFKRKETFLSHQFTALHGRLCSLRSASSVEVLCFLLTNSFYMLTTKINSKMLSDI